jgi:hypothetical protein
MKTEIDPGRRLAAEIAGRRTPSSPLAEHVRREAIAYTRRRLTEGASQSTVARELAVTAMTVSRWLSTTPMPKTALRQRQKARTELRRVRVVEDRVPSRSAVVVTTAHGLRVEGLGVDEVIALLRALG